MLREPGTNCAQEKLTGAVEQGVESSTPRARRAMPNDQALRPTTPRLIERDCPVGVFRFAMS